MAEPLKITLNLDTLSTRYPVFEPDQLLTAAQLNELADYINDGARLARVQLQGIGIVDGLWVQKDGDGLVVSPGLGIDTDGDLLTQPRPQRYTGFKPYGADRPQYAPFFKTPGDPTTLRTLHELVPEGENDVLAQPLTALPDWEKSVVLMFMESYANDPDLCTSTDCDNLGKDAIFQTRFLLLSAEDAAAVAEAEQNLTGGDSARRLPELVADRPPLSKALNNTALLAQAYRTACAAMNKRILDALPAISALFLSAPALFAPRFSSDPAPAWKTRLDTLAGAQTDAGLQYYHAFLKDVMEAWNTLREALLDNEALPFPDFAVFPKHLVLGGATDPLSLRTGFYPSPLEGASREAREYARFLLGKLHVLINAYSAPQDQVISVIPSADETHPLEERAIPFYYRNGNGLAVEQAWHYRRSRRGLAAATPGYRAADWGGVASGTLLNRPLGKHDFFRIEGHLGQPVGTVVTALKKLIEDKNLPFDVQTVLLHNDRKQLRNPPRRYGDLHRLHTLIRKDVAATLDDGVRQSSYLRDKIKNGVDKGEVPTALQGRNTKILAEDHDTKIKDAIQQTVPVLGAKSYQEYRDKTAGGTWMSSYQSVVSKASEYKIAFGTVLRNDHPTALDTVAVDSRIRWLEWLDVFIQDKDDKDDDKLLFPQYIAQHPGLEHAGGVARGGTFVVAYDDKGVVVADFCLPYADEEVYEPLPQQEPELKVPPLTLLDVIKDGIDVIQPLDLRFRKELDSFETVLTPKWTQAINLQEKYFGYLQGSLDIFTKAGTVKTTVPGITGTGIKDGMTGYLAGRVKQEVEQVDTIKEILRDPGTPAETRMQMERELVLSESRLADAVAATSEHVAKSGVPVEQGSDGAIALQIVSAGADKVSSPEARERVSIGLNKAQEIAVAGPSRNAIGAIASTYRIRG